MKIITQKIILITLLLFASCNLFAQLNMTLLGSMSMPMNSSSNNIGGYVDELGNEYAIVCTRGKGAVIIDVSNPTNPILKDTTNTFVDALEVKVRNNYAYVATYGNGLCIIDLNPLPFGHVIYSFWQPYVINYNLNNIHALHIDDEFAYLYGGNQANGGIIIADISNPLNPTIAGIYDNYIYVHDGYVRNDTVWACNASNGFFSAIDVSDKSNPIELAQQETPLQLPHNSWLSENSQYLFTTDERPNSFLTSYDVSDISNIKELDRIQSQHPNTDKVVHNTHIIKKNSREYAVTSWYKDGVVITDVTRPQNMAHVAYIEPTISSTYNYAFMDIFGVYPYLPSGNIIASDMENGLYIYSANYTAACYLEGKVRDLNCSALLDNVKIEINSANILDSTSLSGNYKIGTHLPGIYSATFSKPGYQTKTINNINLSAGAITELDVSLYSANSVNLTVTIYDEFGNPIKDANASLKNTNFEYSFKSNSIGRISKCNLIAGNYDILISKWGYEIVCLKNYDLNHANNNLTFTLKKMYQDDFNFDFGWKSYNNSSLSGRWERVIPKEYIYSGQIANPNIDSDNDCQNKALVTGNYSFSTYNDDVDNGDVDMWSPPMLKINDYGEATVSYSKWFYTSDTTSTIGQSFIVVLQTNNGNTIHSKTIDYFNSKNFKLSQWTDTSIVIEYFINPHDTVYIRIQASDTGVDNEVEAGFDNFKLYDARPDLAITTSTDKVIMNDILIYPNPSTENFTINVNEITEVQITDVHGKMLNEFTTNSTKTFGNELATGIYFVKTTSAKNTSTHKIIKTK